MTATPFQSDSLQSRTNFARICPQRFSKPFGMAQRYTPTNLVSKSAEDARVAVQMCNRLPISVVKSMWRSGRVAECDGLEKCRLALPFDIFG
jgi:hypothetical protein